MGFWEERVVSRMVSWACDHPNVDRQRAKIVPLARGRVLELGMGPGFNLAHYDPSAVSEVIGIEPSARLRAEAEGRKAPVPVTVLDAVAEALPLDDASVDSVVVTYTLCTVGDVATTFGELRRVLVVGGEVLFCEHGRAPDAGVARMQRMLEPMWRRFAGGCHLTRDVPALLASHGFTVETLDTMYLPGPRVLNWNSWGRARKS